MTTDPLAAATAQISEMVTRKTNPLSSLEATFFVTESMSDQDAQTILQRLLAQRFLCQLDADIAQLLAQRLGVEVKWSHTRFDGEWKEGRGQ